MKKKKLLLLGLAAVATISLASCNDKPAASSDTTGGAATTTTGGAATTTTGGAATTTTGGAATTTTVANNGTVDVYINYNKNAGVSYVSADNYVNPIDGVTYVAGNLLPVWKTYQTKLNMTIRDASNYGVSGDAKVHEAISGLNWKSETNPNEDIDLYYNTTANINKMGTEGLALDLNQYINAGKMPNFKAYLDANPAIKEEITYTDGSIYYTPYLDGYNAVERQLVMDTDIVKKLLDEEIGAGLGQLAAGKNGHAKGLVTEGEYQPFIDADYNYAENKEFDILKNGQVTKVTVTKTENIIKQQNASLAAGTTGKALIEQLKSYLTAAYGNQFEKLSDIYVSESACYNTDELIALMRVVKANPDVLYGTSDETQFDEVQGLFPRGQNAGRVNNILQFSGVLFGIQGFGAESGHLYYTEDGKLNDAETTMASYQAVDKLAQLYEEGLILEGFHELGSKSGNAYVDRYFSKKVADLSSFGLIMYDYAATQSTPNDLSNGLGTDPAARKTASTGYSFANKSVQGVRPILAPITYWATESGWDHTAELGSAADRAKKTLTRYYEENRAVKTNSWCIPANSDNVDGALALMDFLFSEEGNQLHNFGPEEYWDMGTVFGKASPVLTAETIKAFTAVGGDIWNFFRQKIGTTHGVGHERPMTLDYQATNDYGKVGYDNITNAINAGVVNLAKTDATSYWNRTVRTSCYPTIDTAIADQYKIVTDFWDAQKLSDTADGWVKVVVGGGLSQTGAVGDAEGTAYTLAEIYALFTYKNQNYLYDYAESIGESYIPTYARPL